MQHRRMAFVYHAVPAAMVGSVLYPLTDLGRVAPRVADLQRLKYVGREGVLQTAITSTGLLFNDTVHCAPVHPYHLYAARRDLDLLPQAEMTDRARKNQRLFFEITLERIVIHPTCWYRWVTPWVNGYPAANVALAPPLDEFEPFDPARYVDLIELPRAHREYLREMKEEARRPLMFVHIPHVLVAGPIETDGVRTISWEEQPS